MESELKIAKDPEGSGPECLFAHIMTSLLPDEALDLLDELDYQWFLSQPLKVLEIFNFNLHFI